MHVESSAGGNDQESNAALNNRSPPSLAAESELLWCMFANTPNPIVAVDESGTIVLSSGGMTKLLGYEPKDLVGEPLDSLLVPDHRASLAFHFRQFFEARWERPMADDMQLVAHHRDGTTLAVNISLRYIELAGRRYAVAEIRDAMEHLGREFDKRLDTLLDSTEDAIIEADLKGGKIRHWNHGAERMFGYTEIEMLGKCVDVLYPSNQAVLFTQIVEQLKSGERIENPHVQRVTKDGSVLDVALVITPIRDKTGVFTSATSIIRNITQQLVAERERKVLERRVNQTERLEGLGQLAGGVAHDFNNLLFLILNYAISAREKLVDVPEVSADVEKIELAAKQAGALTHRLLTFARQEIVEARPVELNHQITELVEFLGQTLGENIELVIRQSTTFDRVIIDPGQLELILLNVVLNSRDAMPDGGTVTIDTKDYEIDSKDAVEYPTLSQGRYVLVEITDTGSGMDSAVLEHIFEPFFTTKQRGEGTGLGMSMAFGVIGQAGGDIEFDSELGVGTTCRIFLPLSDQVAPIESASHDVSVQGRGETILVVEDVVAIREMIEEMLSANGYNVRVTASSPEAIALLETNEGMTDLLLTDVIMPEKSGREVADTFKSVRPDGPVLFISGYANPLALSDLTYEYTLLRKPFSENDLLVTVRNNLEQVR
jgi:hypothetical protein